MSLLHRHLSSRQRRLRLPHRSSPHQLLLRHRWSLPHLQRLPRLLLPRPQYRLLLRRLNLEPPLSPRLLRQYLLRRSRLP